MKGITRSALPALTAWSIAALAAPSAPPEFTHHRADDWINSAPLSLAGLKGKVVLVEFWAFECVNCLNSRAWVESLERAKGAAGLVIVGVHTPELAAERLPEGVRKAVARLGIHNPVMIDAYRAVMNKPADAGKGTSSAFSSPTLTRTPPKSATPCP